MKYSSLYTIISGSFALLCIPLGLVACELEPQGGDPSGVAGMGGEDAGGAPEECASGAALVTTDYFSTEIALLGTDGEVRNPSFLSTASTTTDGLAFPLSGDVVVPLGTSGEIVVLDRFGTNVVSFVNPGTGRVRAQLPVGSGFESNPTDYLQFGEGEGALVRFGQNPAPGEDAFDDGGDLLFIDSNEAEVTGSVVFENYDDLPPRPTNISRVGNDLFVTLGRNALDFSEMGEGMLVPVSLDTKEAGEPTVLQGLKSCGALAPVPGREEVATVCTGFVTITGEVEALSQSALVFFDATTRPLEEVRRIPAESIAGEPLQNQVAFASETVVLLRTQTAYGGARNNRLLAFDWETEVATELLEAEPDSSGVGRGLAFGTILCAPGCGDVCIMPDSSRNEVVRISIEGSAPTLLEPVGIEGGAGLPAAGLGSY